MARIHTQTTFRSQAASAGISGGRSSSGALGAASERAQAQLTGAKDVTGQTVLVSAGAETLASGIRRITGALTAQAQAAGVEVSGTVSSQGNEAPVWDDYYNVLPDAFVGVPYSYDLHNLVDDADEFRVVLDNFLYAHSSLPAGLTLNPATGVISGTPTTEELFVGTALAINGTYDEADDIALCQGLSNVEFVETFPDNASVRDISDVIGGNEEGSTWTGPAGQGGDNTLETLGLGYALRQHILDTASYPGGGGTSAEANWRCPVKANETALAVGEHAWVRYLNKYNRAEVKWPYASQSGGTQHQIKLGIFATLVSNPTPNGFAVVLQSEWGQAHGYTYQSTEGGAQHIWYQKLNGGNPVATSCSGSDFRRNPDVDIGANPLNGTDPGLSTGGGAGSAWTACQQDRARRGPFYSYLSPAGRPDGSPDPLTPGCFMPIDWPFSWMLHVHRVATETTLVEWYFALLGEDWQFVYSEEMPTGGPYSHLHLTNSHTDMDDEPGVRPLVERWHYNVVTRLGSSPLPAPGYTS